MNAENATYVTPEQQNTTNNPETQVIFLDSSNSPNEESTTELIQTEQAPIGDNVVAELQQPTHRGKLLLTKKKINKTTSQ